MLYASASNRRPPCLYICPVANVPGRAPLVLCFIGGNSHPTYNNGPLSHTASRTIWRQRRAAETRAAETRKRHSEAAATSGAAQVGAGAD